MSQLRARLPALVVLGSSSLTVMAAALVAPIIPALQDHFAGHPRVELLAPLILTLPALSIVIAGFGCGYLVDRLGAARLLGLACLIYGACGTVGIWANDLETLAASRLGLGIGIAGIMSAATRLIGQLYTGAARTRMLGRQAAAMAVGSAICLGFGGLLGEGNWRWPFAVYGLGLVFAALSPALPRPETAQNAGPAAAESEPPQPVRRDLRIAGGAAGAVFAFFVLFYVVPVYLPFELQAYTDFDAGASGLFLMVMSGIAGLVSSFFNKLGKKLSNSWLLVGTFAALAVGVGILALRSGLAAIAPAMICVGLALGLVMPTLNNLVVSQVSPGRQGRALGTLSSALFLGQFLSPILWTQVTATALVPSAFAGAAAAAAGLALLLAAVPAAMADKPSAPSRVR